VNPNVTAVKVVVGQVWDDVGAGINAGNTILSAGADVLYSRGDGLTVGVIQAASAKSHPGTANTTYFIGDMADQAPLNDKMIIASSIYNPKPVMENLIAMWNNGTLRANSQLNTTASNTYTWGVKYDSAGIIINPLLAYKIPAGIMTNINAAIAAFKAGTFSMAYDNAGVPTYTGTFGTFTTAQLAALHDRVLPAKP
jgi:basic membrane lipoprotein Med (substrate-binding protein (PBP1-ABC) superfamily)